MEMVGNRRGILTSMINHENQVQLDYVIPSRGLIGFMTDFMTITKGYGIISHSYLEHRPMENTEIASRKAGVLVSINQGFRPVMQCRFGRTGELFIEPGTEFTKV